MKDQEKQNSREQKEQIELISGIPFSAGPFITKKGKARPLRDNLYLNATMSRVVFGDETTRIGTIEVGEKVFKIRQARHSVGDGRLRNMVHPENMDDIRALVEQRVSVDPEIKAQTGVSFHCGEFKTKKGLRFPEGRTIYATEPLRKQLGIEDITGTVVIDGKTYKVRQGRKPAEGDEFENIVHPVEERVVQQFLLNKPQETGKEVKSSVSEVLDTKEG